VAAEFDDVQNKVYVDSKDKNYVYVEEVVSRVEVAIGGPQGAKGDTGPQGVTGTGISSIARTSGTGAPGTTDTFTITYTTGATTTFTVYNGANGSNGTNGRGVTSVVRTSGTGAAGTTDTYTITYSDSTTSTFTVTNGANGAIGTAATITVGTVTGLSAGSTPTVTNAGSSSAAVFNFGIPAGVTGSSGVIGVTSPITNSGTSTSATIGIDQTLLSLTKSQVGLANVDNTSDTNKPVSTAAQTALDLKANIASPNLTGTPLAPTASAGTNTTQIATTAFVGTAVSNLIAAAPAALDTLNELAAALNNDAAFSTTVTNSLAGKATLGAANAFTVGGHTISSEAIGVVPLLLKGSSGQTANLLNLSEFGSATPTSYFNSTGQLRVRAFAGTYPYVAAAIGIESPTELGEIIRGAASQTADLLQYQNSSGTVLGGFNAFGQTYTGSTTTSTGATNWAITAATASSATVATYTGSQTSATNPVVVGQLVTIAGFTTETYFNGTFVVTAIGGISGAWTFTVLGSGFTIASATQFGYFKLPAQASISSTSPSTTGLVVKGILNQATNLQEWQSSTGTALASIAQTGQFKAPSIVGSAFQITSAGVFSNGTTTAPANVQSYFLTTAAANVGQVVRGYATGGAYAQTADLQQWQTWDGTTPTTVAFISNVGNFTAPSVSSTASMSVGSTLTVGSALAGNAGVEIGRVDGTSSTPFIDFHSGATGIDFDSRIIASGGNGTNGQGTLTFYSASNSFAGTVSAYNLVSTVATGTSPLTVTSTTKVTNLNADLLDGYDTAQTAVASTVAVRDTAGALYALGLISSGYKTTDTGGTYVGQWTKVVTLTMASQYTNAVALLDFSSNGPGTTDITHGRIFISVKQQNPMGSAPEQPTVILYNGFNVTIDDFALILTQNDATTTKYDLYFRNNTVYQNVGFVPVVISSTSNVSLLAAQPYITNLPEGLSVNTTNPPETEVTPIDDLSVYFNGVTTRFLLTYQGTKVSLRNPFRLLVTVNGVTQTVNTPDYVWQSPIPYDGLFLDSDGYVAFLDVPASGSKFDGRILAGAATSTRTKNYPFRAVDLLLGA